MEKAVYSIAGDEVRKITLEDKIFNLPINEDLIYYAVLNENANARVGTASTKTRAEVHGSNAKPYKQKGTGNARRGDKKSPILVGGGVIFGPKPRDFSYSMPKKAKRLAIKSILSMQAQSDRFLVVEDFSIESGKTKDLVKVLTAVGKNAPTIEVTPRKLKKKEKEALGEEASKATAPSKNRIKKAEETLRTVVILKDNDPLIKQAGRNIANLSFLSFNRLTARDLYFARRLIVLESAVKNITDFYTKIGSSVSQENAEEK